MPLHLANTRSIRMYELEILLDQQSAIIQTQYDSIQVIRENLPHPIEVEAFGPHFFLSMQGKISDVSLTLKDQSNNEIDHDKYQLKF